MRSLLWRLVVALLVPFHADALLVERDLVSWIDAWSYDYQGAVTYDTSTGLEWLDLTQTQGWSRSSLLDLYGDVYHNPMNYGWRYATHDEVCGLFELRTGPIHGCSGGEFDFGSREGAAELVKFLGVTYADGDLQASEGLFATGRALVYTFGASGSAGVNHQPEDQGGGPSIGNFLVRVPEVHSAVLLLVACLTLMGRLARSVQPRLRASGDRSNASRRLRRSTLPEGRRGIESSTTTWCRCL